MGGICPYRTVRIQDQTSRSVQSDLDIYYPQKAKG